MDIGNKDIKYLTKPLLIIAAIMLLIGLVATVGYRQVSTIYAGVNELKDNQLKLANKLETLESVKDILDENISFVDVALPRKTSVLYGISQIKKISIINNVSVSNLKAGSLALEDNGISKSSITFEVEGEQPDVHKFLLSFYNALPLMSVDKVKINNSGTSARGEVTLLVYSANNPEKIPAVTDAINGLSNEDIMILTKISGYTEPDFFEPMPSDELKKVDPFN